MPDRMTAADSPEVLARISEGMPLVEIIARQLRRETSPSLSVDDLASVGREALLHAARTFDPDRGVPFRRWVNLRVRGAMIDSIRKGGNVPRRVYRKLKVLEAADHVQAGLVEDVAQQPPATPEAADAKLTEYLAQAAAAMALGFMTMRSIEEGAGSRVADDEESPEDQTARAELLAILREAIDERPEQERQLLMRHYFDDVTFEEAARELGLSKSWASRLHARAMEGLAKRLRRDRIG